MTDPLFDEIEFTVKLNARQVTALLANKWPDELMTGLPRELSNAIGEIREQFLTAVADGDTDTFQMIANVATVQSLIRSHAQAGDVESFDTLGELLKHLEG